MVVVIKARVFQWDKYIKYYIYPPYISYGSSLFKIKSSLPSTHGDTIVEKIDSVIMQTKGVIIYLASQKD